MVNNGLVDMGRVRCEVVRLAGLEPTASASAGLRSIQLSYKRVSSDARVQRPGPVADRWCRGRDLNPHARKDTTP